MISGEVCDGVMSLGKVLISNVFVYIVLVVIIRMSYDYILIFLCLCVFLLEIICKFLFCVYGRLLQEVQ